MKLFNSKKIHIIVLTTIIITGIVASLSMVIASKLNRQIPYYRLKNDMVKTTLQLQSNNVQIFLNNIKDYFNKLYAEVVKNPPKTIEDNLKYESHWQGCRKLLNSVSYIFYVNLNGDIQAIAPAHARPTDINYRGSIRPWFLACMEKAPNIAHIVYNDYATNTLLYNRSKIVYDELGNPIGIFVIDILLNAVENHFSEAQKGTNLNYVLLSDQLATIYSSNKTISEYVVNLIPKELNPDQIKIIEFENQTYGFLRIPKYDWILAMHYPLSINEDSFANLNLLTIIFIIIIMLCFTAAAIFISKNINSSQNEIIRTIKDAI
ncbi:MAG: cache domain-containing protein, partial [Lentisphaeria bacterium]